MGQNMGMDLEYVLGRVHVTWPCDAACGFHFHPCSLAMTQLFAPANLSLMLLTIC